MIIGIKTQNEPKIYRNAHKVGNKWEVELESGCKVKYRAGEVSVFDNPTSALDWFYGALDERCETLEKRIVHIRKEAAGEIARLQKEEFDLLK